MSADYCGLCDVTVFEPIGSHHEREHERGWPPPACNCNQPEHPSWCGAYQTLEPTLWETT